MLLEKFPPSLKGKAKVLDEFLHYNSKNPSKENLWKRRVGTNHVPSKNEYNPDKVVSALYVDSIFPFSDRLSNSINHNDVILPG